MSPVQIFKAQYRYQSLFIFNFSSFNHFIQYKIHLWDTAGQEDYDRLRPVAYGETDIVLLVFDRSNKVSLQNIVTKWIPEIDSLIKNKRLVKVLVENKSDLPSQCSDEDCQRLLKQIVERVDLYATTSAVTKDGVESISRMVEEAISHFEIKSKKGKSCLFFSRGSR